jgi:hypothetical protein
MFAATEYAGEWMINQATWLRFTAKVATGIATYTILACITRMEAFGEAKSIAIGFLKKIFR